MNIKSNGKSWLIPAALLALAMGANATPAEANPAATNEVAAISQTNNPKAAVAVTVKLQNARRSPPDESLHMLLRTSSM